MRLVEIEIRHQCSCHQRFEGMMDVEAIRTCKSASAARRQPTRSAPPESMENDHGEQRKLGEDGEMLVIKQE